MSSSDKLLQILINTGRIFATGKSFPHIFSELMRNVREITGAEGGSLYIYDYVSKTLKGVVLTNEPLGINKVVDSFNALKITGLVEVPVRGKNGSDRSAVSVACYQENRKVLVPSLTDTQEYDFSNTHKFDTANNYKTHNLVALPLTGHNGEPIGVFQLINCNDDIFTDQMQSFIDAFAGQVSIMLSNALLVNETQELMSAIIQMIGMAIDEKSPHTAGHCQRVSTITMMLAEALHKTDKPPYREFKLSAEERRELHIAALLHDIGKIITPIHILDKKTKLYTVDDKINTLNERMRTWKISRQLTRLQARLHEEGLDHLLKETDINEEEYNKDVDFLESVNRGEVFADAKVLQRLEEISHRLIEIPGEHTSRHLIKKDELSNLQIVRGTLNKSERKIMEDHVSISIRLLSSIPWPDNLKRVVEYAGAHHENLNGTGYPLKITGEQMSLPARMLGLADRFEGLSAPDRPYRNVKMTLSRVMMIMENMSKNQEIDENLFQFFKDNELHLQYAREYLPADLIDC